MLISKINSCSLLSILISAWLCASKQFNEEGTITYRSQMRKLRPRQSYPLARGCAAVIFSTVNSQDPRQEIPTVSQTQVPPHT